MTNYKAICAIAGITVIAVTALLTGHNGILMGGAMAIIGGIAGYVIKEK